MSARCQWQWASLTRGGGAKLMIVALGCGFALAGSPQLHERVHHSSGRPAHPYAIILRNVDKCVKTVKKQPTDAAVALSPVAPLPEEPVIFRSGFQGSFWNRAITRMDRRVSLQAHPCRSQACSPERSQSLHGKRIRREVIQSRHASRDFE